MRGRGVTLKEWSEEHAAGVAAEAHVRLVTVIADNEGRNGVFHDVAIVAFEAVAVFELPGKCKRMNATNHEEPLLGPFGSIDLHII